MDENPGESIAGPESEYSGSDKGTVRSNGRKPAARKPRTGRPRKSKENQPGPGNPPDPAPSQEAQAENSVEQNKSPYLSENDIEEILKEYPLPDNTPIPQSPGPEGFTSATIILTLLDGIVQMGLGPKYGMTADERKMMREPLDRIMARFPQAQIAQYAQFVDPLLLLMGLIGWGSRIMRMKAEEKQVTNKIEKTGAPGSKNIAEQKPEHPVTQDQGPLPSEYMSPPDIFRLGEV